MEKAVNLVKKQYNLKTYKEKLSDGWYSLWIYKSNHILEIIKKVPREPKSVYDHWVLGKLFGYTEEAIEDFLTNQL